VEAIFIVPGSDVVAVESCGGSDFANLLVTVPKANAVGYVISAQTGPRNAKSSAYRHQRFDRAAAGEHPLSAPGRVPAPEIDPGNATDTDKSRRSEHAVAFVEVHTDLGWLQVLGNLVA
jgi:hypothetical protein